MMAKYKNYFVIGMLLFFVSCGKNNNAQPEIELINQEVFYVEIEPNNSNFGYDNTEQRINATNLITFKVSNPTDRKILLNIGESLWHPMEGKIQKSKEPGMFFAIKDSLSIAKMTTHFINYTNDAFNETVSNIFLYNDSVKKLKYELMGVYYRGFSLGDLDIIDNVIKNSVVVNPTETKMFHVLLKLPLIVEVNLKIGDDYPFYIPEIDKFDTFQLYYSSDAEYLKSILPEYFLKELEENEIEIFDGVLMSNEVPLLKR
jgi:hypothetical protein